MLCIFFAHITHLDSYHGDETILRYLLMCLKTSSLIRDDNDSKIRLYLYDFNDVLKNRPYNHTSQLGIERSLSIIFVSLYILRSVARYVSRQENLLVERQRLCYWHIISRNRQHG